MIPNEEYKISYLIFDSLYNFTANPLSKENFSEPIDYIAIGGKKKNGPIRGETSLGIHDDYMILDHLDYKIKEIKTDLICENDKLYNVKIYNFVGRESGRGYKDGSLILKQCIPLGSGMPKGAIIAILKAEHSEKLEENVDSETFKICFYPIKLEFTNRPNDT